MINWSFLLTFHCIVKHVGIYRSQRSRKKRPSQVKGKVAQLEDGLNYTNSELAEMKGKLEEKAEKDMLKDLEREVEDLRNRSRRNNLVFYNIPEKAEGQDCVAFIKGFINTHMGLEALCGDVEIERAHRTPTKVPVNRTTRNLDQCMWHS